MPYFYSCPVCGHGEIRLIENPLVPPELIIDVCPDCQLTVLKLVPASDDEFEDLAENENDHE